MPREPIDWETLQERLEQRADDKLHIERNDIMPNSMDEETELIRRLKAWEEARATALNGGSIELYQEACETLAHIAGRILLCRKQLKEEAQL